MSKVHRHHPSPWERRAKALEQLLAYYRSGTRPSEKLHQELELTRQLVSVQAAGDGNEPVASFDLVKAGARAITRLARDDGGNRFLQQNARRLSRAVLEEPEVADALGVRR